LRAFPGEPECAMTIDMRSKRPRGRIGGVLELADRLLPLIAAGHGIAGLTIERPSLHEAFVRIVGDHAGHDRTAGEKHA